MSAHPINLGGIHHAEGRAQVLPYLHLRPDERSALREIASTGATVSARDLPASRRVSLDELPGA